jgi:pimeloyl-ACP methyl ester carboxylesterase/transcriptional regulator with XRE-family HTH domain
LRRHPPQAGRMYDAAVLTRSTFGELLRRHRLGCGWTQNELAERAGLSTRAISDLERGANEGPRLVTVRLLIEALGLGAEDAAALRSAASRQDPTLVGHPSEGTDGTQLVAVLEHEVAAHPEQPRSSVGNATQVQLEVHYATRADGSHTAYGFAGKGPLLLIAPGFINHLEWCQRAPRTGTFLKLLTDHRTIVLYDRHGCGLSDRDRTDFTSEDDMQDIEAVVAAMRVTELDLLGISWGSRPAIVLAVRRPELVRRLVLYGAAAPGGRIDDIFLERRDAMATLRRTDFDLFIRAVAMQLYPSGPDEETLRTFVQLMHMGASPEMQERLEGVRFDLEPILGAITSPTLVMHRRDDHAAPFAHGQNLARRIPNARFIPLEGTAHMPWEGDSQSVIGPMLEFLLEPRDVPRHT